MKTRHLLTSFALALLALIGALTLVGAWGDELSAWSGASVARAQAGTGVIRVATTGTDTIGCGSVIIPCGTLQYAVDQASDGDTIKVAAGTYADVYTYTWFTNPIYPYSITQIALIDKDLTIQGGYTTADWENQDPNTNPTTLDARGQGRVFYIAKEHDVVLDGLQIVNGQTPQDGPHYGVYDGGGIYYEDRRDTNGRLTIRDCTISGNSSSSEAGGVYVHHGILVVQNSRIVNNVAASTGGGIYVHGAAVTMTNSFVQDNTAGISTGGAYLECMAYVAYNTFQGNRAATNDNGGLLALGDGDLVLTHNTFLNNVADGLGGGLHVEVWSGYTYTITHNIFQGNTAAVTDTMGRGGGAYLVVDDGAQLVFNHNQVLDNIANECRTPWSKGEGGGVKISADSSSLALVSDNLFQNNWAATGSQCTGKGGGLFIAGPARLERNRILNNRASRYPDWGGYFMVLGGGVYIHHQSTVTMTNNILAGNKYFEEDDNPFALDNFSYGGAIYVGGQTMPTMTQLTLFHNTIADNQSPAVLNESAKLTMNHNIFAGHAVDLRTILDATGASSSQPPTTTADYTLWYPSKDTEIDSGTFAATNDFVGAPGFVNTTLDNYHLGSTSQAIDRGLGVGVTDDVDGHPRPIGAAYDLGADEFTNVDLSTSTKSATPQEAGAGEQVTFTIVLRNSGSANAANTVFYDAIPAGTTYVPGSVQATAGSATDADGIRWTGTVPAAGDVTISFRVTADEGTLIVIVNTATVTDTYDTVSSLSAWVNPYRICLPIVTKNYSP